ncbi:MAG: hypothetical protein PWQ63_1355 [Methanolobus sp.]|nr:hypothetical protein [Methanolobus sp.]
MKICSNSFLFLLGLLVSFIGLILMVGLLVSGSFSLSEVLFSCGIIAAGLPLTLLGLDMLLIKGRSNYSHFSFIGYVVAICSITAFLVTYSTDWFLYNYAYVIIPFFAGNCILFISLFLSFSSQRSVRKNIRDFDEYSVPGKDNSMFSKIPSGSPDPSYQGHVSAGKIPRCFMVTKELICCNEGSLGVVGRSGESVDTHNMNDPASSEKPKVANESASEVHEGGNKMESVEYEFSDRNEGEREKPFNDPVENVSELSELKGPDENGFDLTISPAVTEMQLEDTEKVKSKKKNKKKNKKGKSLSIERHDTMGEAARKIVFSHFNTMIDHEDGTKLGQDIEELHDMRVGAMRMRAAYQVFDEYLDNKKVIPFLKPIKRTRKVLGSVRDMDVLLEKIQHYLDELPPERRSELDPLKAAISIERDKSRGMMLVYLDDSYYNKFKDKFHGVLKKKKFWSSDKTSKNKYSESGRVQEVLPVLLYRHFSSIRSYDKLVSVDDPSLEILHELRIEVKILRYTLEFFKDVLSDEAKDAIKDLKSLQDNLGDMHDAVVAIEMLERFLKYGVWGDSNKRSSHLKKAINSPEGVESYLAFRKDELRQLLDEFPAKWANILGPEFGQKFSMAVSGLYEIPEKSNSEVSLNEAA